MLRVLKVIWIVNWNHSNQREADGTPEIIFIKKATLLYGRTDGTGKRYVKQEAEKKD